MKVVTEGLTHEQTEMVMANLGLIGFTLRKWGRQVADPHYSDDDAWQDGFFGLCRAVQIYDPERGTKFSTLAVIWIRQAIQRGGGTFAGRNTRRAYERPNGGVDLPALPVSIDADWRSMTASGDEMVSLVGVLSSSDDTEGEAVADALRAAMVALKPRICRNIRDEAIFDSLTNPVEGVSRVRQDTEVAERLGVTREAVRKGRLKMAGQLAYHLGLEVAA